MRGLKSDLFELSTARLNGPLLILMTLSMIPMLSVYLVSSASAVTHGVPAHQLVDQVAAAPGASIYLSGLLVGILALIAATTEQVGPDRGSPRRPPRFSARLLVAAVLAVAATLLVLLTLTVSAIVLLPADLLQLALQGPQLWTGMFGVFSSHLTWASVGSLAGFWIGRTAPGVGLLVVLMQGPGALSFGLRSIGFPAVQALDLLPPGLIRSATLTDPGAADPGVALSACWVLLAWCVLLGALGWVFFRRRR